MWIIIKKRWFISFIGSSWPIQRENHKYSFMNKYKKEEFFTYSRNLSYKCPLTDL